MGRPSEQAGEHVDHAVVDDQQVNGSPLRAEDCDGGQQVDQHGDHRDRDVGEQVALSLGHIHLLSRMQLLICFVAFKGNVGLNVLTEKKAHRCSKQNIRMAINSFNTIVLIGD